jgi:hypothetical protein
VGRTERPNGKVALSYWLDTCWMWLRARNCVASDLDASALVLACYAAGDVVYSPADAALGNVWELGLVEYGGKPASPDAWRGVGRRRLEVEYQIDRDRQFDGFEFVDADSPPSRWSTICGGSFAENTRAGRIMRRDFRSHYFGKHKRLTKEGCEEFFSNDANFIDA